MKKQDDWKKKISQKNKFFKISVANKRNGI